MKDLLKTYAPLVALAIGAFVYWSLGQVSALRETVNVLQVYNANIVLGITRNCEAFYEQEGLTTVPKEEVDAQTHTERKGEEPTPQEEKEDR